MNPRSSSPTQSVLPYYEAKSLFLRALTANKQEDEKRGNGRGKDAGRGVNREIASRRKSLRDKEMGGRGLKHPALTPPKTPISEDERTESGTVDGEKAHIAPDLAKVIEAWPQLPEAVRSAILTLVKAAVDGKNR